MTVKLAPVTNLAQYFDNLGYQLSGGKLFYYIAGSTSVLATTYSSDETPNPNPIVLDSSGRNLLPVWLDTTTVYNIVLTDASGTVLQTLDNVSVA